MTDQTYAQLSCYLVDDDPSITELVTLLLQKKGHVVASNTSSIKALPEIIAQRPQLVILDIMMPEMDGLEMCKLLREQAVLSETTIVMLSSKTYEFDKQRAYQFGANGYLEKPLKVESIVDELYEIMADKMELSFWGIRGTLPVPGTDTVRYGGNTSCVSVSFPQDRLFIFDGGSGIKALSDHLLRNRQQSIRAKIFISHPHWDHINALPFFVPFFISGNEFEICGPAQGDITMHQLISAQMDNVYFPITIKEFSASVHYRDLREDVYEIDGIEVRTMLLKHPGYCLGYRLNYKGRSICYVTDNELYPEATQMHDKNYLNHLIEFIKGADVLITDCTYFDEEYPAKVGWGHSSIGEVTRLAHAAEVKDLYLFHHDPDHKDDDIDRKLEVAKNLLRQLGSNTGVIAPAEGNVVRV